MKAVELSVWILILLVKINNQIEFSFFIILIFQIQKFDYWNIGTKIIISMLKWKKKHIFQLF